MASDGWGVRGFRVCFIPLAGCFSPFPHGTGPLAVAEGLEPWRVVPPASHKLTGVRGTQEPIRPSTPASPTGLSPSLAGRSSPLGWPVLWHVDWSYNPSPSRKKSWFGLLPVRSPLLGESRLISCRAVTEMFQFTAGPSRGYAIHHGMPGHHPRRVAPFGIFGLLARMQLPRNVSPVSASFIGLQCRGIHLVLCVACSFLLLASHPALKPDLRLGDGIRSSSASHLALRQN